MQGWPLISETGLDLRHLQIIEAAERHGQLTLAAEELGLSPSAVTRAISAVEDALGTRLCERSRAGVAFSEAGKTFVRLARESLDRAERTLAFGRELAAARAGVLRVGFLATAIKFGMQDHLARLHARLPEVDLRLSGAASSAALVDGLVTGALDVAYLEPPLPVNGLGCREVGRSDWALALPPDHPLASSGRLTARDLRGLRLMQDAPTRWPTLHTQLLHRCAEEGFVPDLDVSEPNGFARLILVGSGVGASLAPLVFGTDQFDRTVYVPLDEPSFSPLRIAAAWADPSENPIIGAFVEALDAALADRGDAEGRP